MKIKRFTFGMVAVFVAILSMSFAAATAARETSSLQQRLNSAPLRIGTISGTVTNADGDPLAGIHINADPVQSVEYDYTSATTDENGAYTLAVPVGVYRLHFYDNSGVYLETWYGGETWSDADELPVPGTDVTGIDIVMSRGGTISGSVAFGDGMPAAEYVQLDLRQAVDDGWGVYWNSIRWAEVDVNSGSDWTFTQVPAGTFRICAYANTYDSATGTSNDMFQCYGGATVEEATDITIDADGSLDGIELTFTPPEYTISGTVTDDAGEPVGGVYVNSYAIDSSHYTYFNTTTNADGTYELPANSGTYEVSFYDDNNEYEHAFVNGVVVDAESVSGIDVVMGKNYGISGTLIPADGSTVYEANLTAYQWEENTWDEFSDGHWMDMGWGYVHGSNDYFISGLQPGTYRVCAYTYDEMYNGSGQVCYGGGSEPADGTDVVVVEGEDTTGIDINLADIETGTIAGVVTDVDGNPLEGIEVSAEFDWNAMMDSMTMYGGGYGYTTTDADGVFELNITPGTYIVRFNDYDGNYISETYDNLTGYVYEEYTPVEVADSETVTISAELEISSKLVGTITLEGGGEISWGSVEVLKLDEQHDWYNSVGWGDIMEGGEYAVQGMGAGTYRVCYWFDMASGGGYDVYGYGYMSHYECYDGASVPEEGTDVEIGANETVTLDITVDTMAPEVDPDNPGTIILPEDSGVITGTVTDSNGDPLPNIKVQLYKAYDDYNYYYPEPDMPPMPIDLFIPTATPPPTQTPEGNQRSKQSNVSVMMTATPTVIPTPASDIIMPPMPIDMPPIDMPIPIPILAPDYGFDGAYEVVYTFTDENGQYKIGSLPDGTYHVGFSDPMGAYSSQFYDGRNELHNSTPINIEVSQTVTDINGTLAVAGQIGGVIGLGTLSNTSEHIQLSLMDMNYYEIAWGNPDADGNYLFGGLPAGEYILYAYTWDGDYRDEYYEDSQFFEGATPITVVEGEMTTIDFVLDAPAEGLITSSNPDMMWVDPWTGEINLFIDPWMPETVLTAESNCDGTTTAATLVIGWEWDELSNNEFEMSQNDDGSWSTTVTTDDWLEGNVTLNWTCNDEVIVQEVGSSMLYDPSGTIVDEVTGTPIEGATVTLHQVPNALPDTADEERNCRSVDTLVGSWLDEPLAQADAGVVVSVDMSRSQPNFSPAVPSQTTADDGVFGWEVAEGCWYVTASAPGYESSTSPVVGVPPEVTGLLISLTPTESIPTAVSLTDVATTPSTITISMMLVLVTLASSVLVVRKEK